MLLLEKRMTQCKSLFSVPCYLQGEEARCMSWLIYRWGSYLRGGLNRGFTVVTSIPNEWEKRAINANSKWILRHLFVGVYVMFVTLVCFLNMGVENDIFGPGIGSRFGEQGGTPLARFARRTPGDKFIIHSVKMWSTG